ncbi:hypothetical protein ACM66B_001878 [Microbotryomycetes sp. NB124-2]
MTPASTLAVLLALAVSTSGQVIAESSTESCFPSRALPPQVSCYDSVQEGTQSTTCLFPNNGNDPYTLRLRHRDTVIDRMSVQLHGEAGQANRFYSGGFGASLNGTLHVSHEETLFLYVGAGIRHDATVRRARPRRQQLYNSVFWGRGGGFTSLGTGPAAGFQLARSECALSNFGGGGEQAVGDCRILVAAGGGGAGPSSPGEPAGASVLGMTTSSMGQSPRDGSSGGGGAGLVGAKTRRGHGGGGGLSYIGQGRFDLLDKQQARSQEASAIVTFHCSSELKEEHESSNRNMYAQQTVFAQSLRRRMGLQRLESRH